MKQRTLLFNASAGSGKTYNLAVQYIVLLVTKSSQEFAHTLAVTFTNKATAEMKDRILEQLWGIGNNHPDSENYLESVKKEIEEMGHEPMTDEEIREKCRQALETILHDYSRFSVSTIDAFFQTVLRNMAHELGLNANLQVDLNDENVLELAVDNIIDSLRHDDQEVLPWLRGYIKEKMESGSKWDVRGELKKISKCLFQEVYLTRELDSNNKAFTTQEVSNFKAALQNRKASVLAPVKAAAQQCENVLSANGLDYGVEISNGKNMMNFLHKCMAGDIEKLEWGTQMQGRIDKPLEKLFIKKYQIPSLLPAATQEAAALQNLKDELEKAQKMLNSIDMALKTLTPMGLLGVVDKEVQRINSENNQFMLAKTPILLKKMIGDSDASFVFEKIGNIFNNIMIDEFQDTSNLQWENFKTLLLNAMANGGFEMLVGDIKQSIYRWRNGDWKILHEQGKKSGISKRPLKVNRRSLQGIVDFNNGFFKPAARVLDTRDPGASFKIEDIYEDVEQEVPKKHQHDGHVEVQLMTSDDDAAKEAWQEQMLASMCEKIQHLHAKGVDYKKMALILRKRKFIQPTLEYFAQHMPDVHLVSDEAFQLNTAISINMIINALQVINDPERDPVALRYLMKHFKADVLKEQTSENDYCLVGSNKILPDEFTQHIPELRNIPLNELCEQLYKILHLSNIENEEAYVFCFFDELSAYLRDNASDIASFLDYWNEELYKKAIPGGEVDGIRIFTIHKSKGLQFHTVLMPFAEWTIEQDMRFGGDQLWCTPKDPDLGLMGSIPVSVSSKMNSSVFADDYGKEHLQRRVDELNSLYVAFTRAEENLFVWGHANKGDLETSCTVADLMYKVIPQIEGIKTEETETLATYTYDGPDNEVEDEPEKVKPINRLNPPFKEQGVAMCSYATQVEFRQSQQASKFIHQAGEEFGEPTPEQPETETLSKDQLTYIEKGKLLHLIFSEIETEDDLMDVVKRFEEQGIIESEGQRNQVISLVKRGLKNEVVRDWFSAKYRLFNECNILVPNAETHKPEVRRPDRVMMSDNRIIIVDFKFGKPQPEHQQQVQEYMQILQSMHPDHQVEGWLWYVYRNETLNVEKK